MTRRLLMIFSIFTIILNITIIGSLQAYAIVQPSEEHIQRLREEGRLEQVVEAARRRGNHIPAPHLVERMASLGFNFPNAFDENFNPLLSQVPLSRFGGTPTTGDVNVLVLLIDFPDFPATAAESVTNMRNLMFGAANPASNVFPYESMSAFYYRSSYGQLRLDGEVWGHFTAPNNSTFYTNYTVNFSQPNDIVDFPNEDDRAWAQQNRARDALIEGALDYFIAQGLDLSQFDNGGAGVVDSIFFKWTAPEGDWRSFWWGQQTGYDGERLFQGYRVGQLVWQPHISTEGANIRGANLAIHEFGHLLGLPDFYDLNRGNPMRGIGQHDMMDANIGDHNAFSKFLLGWIEPVIIGTGSGQVTIGAGADIPSAVIIMPDATLSATSSFYMIEFRQQTGNNARPNRPFGDTRQPNWMGFTNPFTPAGNFVIWHVSSYVDWGNFRYNNTNTARPLLSLVRRYREQSITGFPMESHTWQIGNWGFSATFPWRSTNDDFYGSEHYFPMGQTDSNRWDDTPTGISITNMQINGAQNRATANFSIAGNVRGPRLIGQRYNIETGEFIFTFDSLLTDVNLQGIQIQQKGGGIIQGTGTIDNNRVIFRPTVPLARKSRFNITIPANIVRNSHNLNNVAYDFTIITPPAFIYVDSRLRVNAVYNNQFQGLAPASVVFRRWDENNQNWLLTRYMVGSGPFRYMLWVENLTELPVTAHPVLSYFINGVLIHTEIRPSITISADGGAWVSGDITNLPPNAEEDVVVKLMLWEDLNLMQPLTTYFLLK